LIWTALPLEMFRLTVVAIAITRLSLEEQLEVDLEDIVEYAPKTTRGTCAEMVLLTMIESVSSCDEGGYEIVIGGQHRSAWLSVGMVVSQRSEALAAPGLLNGCIILALTGC
jgi:hypothetical protein